MLTAADRKTLKARAHKLEPVVMIGAKGLTEELIAEVERALAAHELIKVRAGTLEREARGQAFAMICERTAAELVQEVGKVAVIFRKNKT